MAKLLSRLLFVVAAIAGGLGGWALFGVVAKPNEKAASTGTTGTGATGTGATASTGVATVSTLSPPTITTPSPPSTTAPHKHGPPPKPHPSSRAVFTIDGKTYRLSEYLVVQTGGYVKALNYSGPTGCSGRYFYIGRTGAFRYTAHNALLQMGGTLYTFGEPPTVVRKTLVWNVTFTGGGHTDHVKVVLYCQLPRKSIPPLPGNGG